jgi:hypothetical protein
MSPSFSLLVQDKGIFLPISLPPTSFLGDNGFWMGENYYMRQNIRENIRDPANICNKNTA